MSLKRKPRHQAKYAKITEPVYHSHWWLLLILWLASVIPEFFLHISTAADQASLWNAGVYISALFSLVPALIVFTIISLIPWRKVNIGIIIAYSVLYALLCCAQIVYYSIFGTYFSAYAVANGAAAMQFWKTALEHIGTNIHWILLVLLPTLFVSIVMRLLFQLKGMRSWRLSLIPLVAAFALQALTVGMLPVFDGKDTLSAFDMYHNGPDAYYGINKLGLLTGLRLDVNRLITGEEPDGTVDLEATMPSFDLPPLPTITKPRPTTQPTTLPDGSTHPTTEPVPTDPPIDTSPNILDIDFETLIAEAKDKTIANMHKYFQNRTPTNKNAYTGMFEGCNLVMICAESFSCEVVDPMLTPTLYKMMTEGMYFENFYVPSWFSSTIDGEYVFLTGTIPKSGTMSLNKTRDNHMPLTMSMQLINKGYNAFAYHGHKYNKTYMRNKYMPNMGYDYKDPTCGLDIKIQWPESDYDVVDKSTGFYVDKEPFITYYMSISGHLGYSFMGNNMASRNKDAVKHLPYSEAVQAYIACNIEFEKSMKLMMERFEEAGVLENTVFVIVPDHYPYGLEDGQYAELQGIEGFETFYDIYRTGCIIYKPGMEPQTISTLSSHLDLLPTLSNLFGIEYDSRLYMGRDIFSDSMSLVMFNNKSWITDYVAYNASTKKYTYFVDETLIPEGFTDYIKAEVKNRFTVSRQILDNDYWAILFPKDE